MSLNSNPTTSAFRDMVPRVGGGFHLSNNTYYPLSSSSYVTAINNPDGYKPFEVSIYNKEKDIEEVTLTLMVNPTDISIGQVFVSNSAYTRKGWLPTLWGRQQSTITGNGKTSGFYYDSNVAQITNGIFSEKHEGLVNSKRRDTLPFINLLTLISMYKNNGNYFLNTPADQTYYRDGTSRVITVMDSIKISYDDSEYIGSFSTFTVNDTGDKPYNIDYNFEFIVSGLRGDKIDGHLRQGDNDLNPSVEISIQGQDTSFIKTVRMSEEELNKHYKIDPKVQYSQMSYNYEEFELYDEQDYYNPVPNSSGYWDTPEGRAKVSPVPPDTIRVARGGLDGEGHDGKIDYRTSSGEIRSLTEGVIFQKAWNFIVVKSKVVDNGKVRDAYVRYYHIDSESMTSLPVGTEIRPGDLLGSEGTDNGKYPPHCDFEVRAFDGASLNNVQYKDAERIDATTVFNTGVNRLKEAGNTDYQKTEYKHGNKKGV